MPHSPERRAVSERRVCEHASPLLTGLVLCLGTVGCGGDTGSNSSGLTGSGGAGASSSPGGPRRAHSECLPSPTLQSTTWTETGSQPACPTFVPRFEISPRPLQLRSMCSDWRSVHQPDEDPTFVV